MKLRNMTSIYIQHGSKMLLLYRVGSRLFSNPLWCGIGGHFEDGELNEPRRCVLRELQEETGITENDLSGLRLKYITIRRKGDEIRQQYIYFAESIRGDMDLSACDEGVLKWTEIEMIPSLQMSYTNSQCLSHYFAKGQYNAFVYAGVATNDNGKPGMVFTAIEDFETNYI